MRIRSRIYSKPFSAPASPTMISRIDASDVSFRTWDVVINQIASVVNKAKLDKDAMTNIFLKYKSSETGDIDWRPTETIPEDYYAF